MFREVNKNSLDASKEFYNLTKIGLSVIGTFLLLLAFVANSLLVGILGTSVLVSAILVCSYQSYKIGMDEKDMWYYESVRPNMIMMYDLLHNHNGTTIEEENILALPKADDIVKKSTLIDFVRVVKQNAEAAVLLELGLNNKKKEAKLKYENPLINCIKEGKPITICYKNYICKVSYDNDGDVTDVEVTEKEPPEDTSLYDSEESSFISVYDEDKEAASSSDSSTDNAYDNMNAKKWFEENKKYINAEIIKANEEANDFICIDIPEGISYKGIKNVLEADTDYSFRVSQKDNKAIVYYI